MVVVLSNQMVCHHQVIDILEDQGALRRILVLSLQEADRVVSPMPAGVQVVRCVISVVEAETVALSIHQIVFRKERSLLHTGTSIRVMLDRKSESGSISSTSAC